jgi:hypothetical protein
MDAPTADAEARAFLLDSLRALLTAAAEQLPAEADSPGAASGDIGPMLELLQNLEDTGADFGPEAFTMVLQPDGAELASAFTVNLPKGAPMLRLVLEYTVALGAVEHERDGLLVYELVPDLEAGEQGLTEQELETLGTPPQLYLGLQHDTPIFGSSKELVFDLLQATAFEDEPGSPPSGTLRDELAGLRSEWLLAAAAVDDPLLDVGQLLTSGLAVHELDLAWSEAPFALARLGVGVDERDLALRLEVSGLDPVDIERVRSGFEQLCAAQAAVLAEHELELAYEVLPGAESMLIQVGLPGLRDWLDRRIRLTSAAPPASE